MRVKRWGRRKSHGFVKGRRCYFSRCFSIDGSGCNRRGGGSAVFVAPRLFSPASHDMREGRGDVGGVAREAGAAPHLPAGVRYMKSQAVGFSSATRTAAHLPVNGEKRAVATSCLLEIVLQRTHFERAGLEGCDGFGNCCRTRQGGVVGHLLHQRGAADRL